MGYGGDVAGDIGDILMAAHEFGDLPDPDSSLWAWLAHDLRFYRMKHGLSLAQLGRIIGRTRGSVSACEHGRRRINDQEAKILDDTWNTGGHFQRLLRFARLNHDPNWFEEHLGYEARAAAIKIYELAIVPGLFQTPAYARALMVAAGIREVDAMVDARIARQEIIIKPDPPLMWVLLSENVLDWPIGGPATMSDQLARLLEVSEFPNVTIRVVPRSAGAHIGVDGPFKVITVSEGDVAYTEAHGGGRLILDTQEIRKFGVRYDRIGAVALPVDLSRGLIERAMEAMR